VGRAHRLIHRLPVRGFLLRLGAKGERGLRRSRTLPGRDFSWRRFFRDSDLSGSISASWQMHVETGITQKATTVLITPPYVWNHICISSSGITPLNLRKQTRLLRRRPTLRG
jgi:hypothetical protein